MSACRIMPSTGSIRSGLCSRVDALSLAASPDEDTPAGVSGPRALVLQMRVHAGADERVQAAAGQAAADELAAPIRWDGLGLGSRDVPPDG